MHAGTFWFCTQGHGSFQEADALHRLPQKNSQGRAARMKPAATERNGVQFFIAAVTPNDLLYGRMIIHVKKNRN